VAVEVEHFHEIRWIDKMSDLKHYCCHFYSDPCRDRLSCTDWNRIALKMEDQYCSKVR
jgi:hypothetical protein